MKLLTDMIVFVVFMQLSKIQMKKNSNWKALIVSLKTIAKLTLKIPNNSPGL